VRVLHDPNAPRTQNNQPKYKDAFAYLERLRRDFAHTPRVYERFLEIMREFREDRITTEVVISRVSELFADRRDLILKFNTFLPPGYTIEVDGQTLEELQASEASVASVGAGAASGTATGGAGADAAAGTAAGASLSATAHTGAGAAAAAGAGPSYSPDAGSGGAAMAALATAPLGTVAAPPTPMHPTVTLGPHGVRVLHSPGAPRTQHSQQQPKYKDVSRRCFAYSPQPHATACANPFPPRPLYPRLRVCARGPPGFRVS
jgi:hypothetical protein